MSSELARPQSRLRLYDQVLRRRAMWVLLVIVIGAAAALLYSLSQSTVYTATALVNVTAPVSPGQSVPSNTISTQQLASDAQIATSSSIAAAAAASIGHITASVSATASTSNTLIAIHATDANPKVAADTANAFAKAFTTYEDRHSTQLSSRAAAVLTKQINTLSSQISALRSSLSSAPGSISAQSQAVQTQLSGLLTQENTLVLQRAQADVSTQLATGDFTFSAPATPPSSPSSANPAVDVPLGALAGLVVGLGVAAAVDTLDDSVRTRSDVARALPGVPVLGLVPFLGASKRSRLVSIAVPDSAAAESFRSLRAALQSVWGEGRGGLLLVTSACPGEGKSSTVANLGVALARAGRQVCVMSADLHRPRLGDLLSLPLEPGLTSLATGALDLDDVLIGVESVPGLSYLGGGAPLSQPGDLLSSRTVVDVLEQLRARFDVVLIDTPPLATVADAMALVAHADRVLLVVRQGATTPSRLSEVAAQLVQTGHNLAGCVLHEASARSFRQWGETFGLYGGDDRTSRHESTSGSGASVTSVRRARQGVTA